MDFLVTLRGACLIIAHPLSFPVSVGAVRNRGNRGGSLCSTGNFISSGSSCSRYTDPWWGWPRECLPESYPRSSNFRWRSGSRTPGRCIQRICWHDSSYVFPPSFGFESSMDGLSRNIPTAKSIKAGKNLPNFFYRLAFCLKFCYDWRTSQWHTSQKGGDCYGTYQCQRTHPPADFAGVCSPVPGKGI